MKNDKISKKIVVITTYEKLKERIGNMKDIIIITGGSNGLGKAIAEYS